MGFPKTCEYGDPGMLIFTGCAYFYDISSVTIRVLVRVRVRIGLGLGGSGGMPPQEIF